jgi:hypothetical protein
MTDPTIHAIYRRLPEKEVRWFGIEKTVVAGALGFAALFILFAFSVFMFG